LLVVFLKNSFCLWLVACINHKIKDFLESL
jgi:hypothetical protein